MFKVNAMVKRDRLTVIKDPQSSNEGPEETESLAGGSSSPREQDSVNPHVSPSTIDFLTKKNNTLFQDLIKRILKRCSRFCPALPICTGQGLDDATDVVETTPPPVANTSTDMPYDPRLDTSNFC